MANALYTAYKQVTLGDNAIPTLTSIDWEGGDTIGCVLTDSADYTVNLNTHTTLNDVPAIGRVATANVTNPQVVASGGTVTVSGDNTTFNTVTGDQSEYVIIYKNTGTATTSLLAVFFDTFSSGMPVTPNGGNITVQWNASGIWSW